MGDGRGSEDVGVARGLEQVGGGGGGYWDGAVLVHIFVNLQVRKTNIPITMSHFNVLTSVISIILHTKIHPIMIVCYDIDLISEFKLHSLVL